MKKVYIAHPLRGGGKLDAEVVTRNFSRADTLCRRLSDECPDVHLLSPIHAYGFVSPLGPQDWVLQQCLALLSLADELWVFGDYQTSKGCCMEIEHARRLGKPIVFEDGRVEGKSGNEQLGDQ